jgi:hypothetical protein
LFGRVDPDPIMLASPVRAAYQITVHFLTYLQARGHI